MDECCCLQAAHVPDELARLPAVHRVAAAAERRERPLHEAVRAQQVAAVPPPQDGVAQQRLPAPLRHSGAWGPVNDEDSALGTKQGVWSGVHIPISIPINQLAAFPKQNAESMAARWLLCQLCLSTHPVKDTGD